MSLKASVVFLLLTVSAVFNCSLESHEIPSGSEISLTRLSPDSSVFELTPPETAKSDRLPELELVKGESNYFHPGILLKRDGKWTGGDYLLYVPTQIGVYLNIVEPEGVNTGINKENLLEKISSLFTKNGITPVTMIPQGAPPLPFFQIQVLIYPFGSNYAAYCRGTLYEEVLPKRFSAEQNILYQAITWQRESLIVVSSTAFLSQIDKSITETVNAFIERFRFYSELQRNAQKGKE